MADAVSDPITSTPTHSARGFAYDDRVLLLGPSHQLICSEGPGSRDPVSTRSSGDAGRGEEQDQPLTTSSTSTTQAVAPVVGGDVSAPGCSSPRAAGQGCQAQSRSPEPEPEPGAGARRAKELGSRSEAPFRAAAGSSAGTAPARRSNLTSASSLEESAVGAAELCADRLHQDAANRWSPRTR